VEVARALGVPVTAVDVERVNARGLRLGAATATGLPTFARATGVSADDVAQMLERAARPLPHSMRA
jgi:hypothetical protein